MELVVVINYELNSIHLINSTHSNGLPVYRFRIDYLEVKLF